MDPKVMAVVMATALFAGVFTLLLARESGHRWPCALLMSGGLMIALVAAVAPYVV